MQKGEVVRRGLQSTSQAILDHIPRELDIRFQVEFFQNARAIGVDSLMTEREILRDIFSAFSRGNHAKHLVFAIGEGRVLWLF